MVAVAVIDRRFLCVCGRAVRIVLCLLADGRMIRRPEMLMANDGEDEDVGSRIRRAWVASQLRSTGDDHLDRFGRPRTQDHPRRRADVPSQPFRPGSGRSTSFRDPAPDVVEEGDRLVSKDVVGDSVSEKVKVRGKVVYDGDVDEDEEEADNGHCNARDERREMCQPVVRRERWSVGG